MTEKKQGFWGPIVLATLLIVVATSAQAAVAPYPTKKITIIVPFKPGGGFDLQARMLSMHLEKYLPNKVNIIIENVAGAGGKMGAVQLAKSKPDGYTIGVVGLESVAFMRALGQLQEDPQQWTFLGQLSSDPLLVAVNASAGLKTLADMKAKDFRFGITSEMLASAAVICKTIGAKFRPVLFDGSGDAVLAGMRGDVDALVFSWPTMIKGVRDSQGKMNCLFVPNQSRLPSLPDVPTLAELGVRAEPGVYAVVATSRIIVAPAGVDKAIQGILVNTINKATSDPEFVKQMKRAEFDIATAKPAEVKIRVKAAVDEFTAVKDMVKSYAK